MAKKYLTHINLNQNELQNVALQRLASDPGSPVSGQIYYHTGSNTVRYYDGTEWVTFGSGEGSGDMLASVYDPTNVQEDAFARANHTGTQTASTISDFDTEVEGNTDVSANTSARHSHTNKATLDATTASYTTAEETKLSGIDEGAEVNAVDSVNTQTGAVVLDADDIADSTTTNKFATAGQLTKVDHLTVTAATDLDTIRGRVNELDSAVVLQGSWDASGGSFPSGTTAGDSYVVSTTGTVDGVTFTDGDRLLSLTDSASTTTYASNWLKLDYTDRVNTVNGETGTVVLTTGDITEDTDANYVTDAEKTVIGNTSGTNTGDEPTATTTAEGVVELATVTEAKDKSASNRAVTPAGLADYARVYTETIGDGSATSIAVTHGLGSQWVTAQVYEVSTDAQVECEVTLTSSTQTTFGFATAPTSNAIRVVITG